MKGFHKIKGECPGRGQSPCVSNDGKSAGWTHRLLDSRQPTQMIRLINAPTTGKVSIGLTINRETKMYWNQASLVPLVIDYSVLSSCVSYMLPAGFHPVLGHQQCPLWALTPLPLFCPEQGMGMGKERFATSPHTAFTCLSGCLGRAKALFTLFLSNYIKVGNHSLLPPSSKLPLRQKIIIFFVTTTSQVTSLLLVYY